MSPRRDDDPGETEGMALVDQSRTYGDGQSEAAEFDDCRSGDTLQKEAGEKDY